jgi:hypothetical protein
VGFACVAVTTKQQLRCDNKKDNNNNNNNNIAALVVNQSPSQASGTYKQWVSLHGL